MAAAAPGAPPALRTTGPDGRRQWGHGTRHTPDLPGRGTGRRQDVRDALRGAPQGRARHRLRGGLRGAPRPAAYRGAAARSRADPPQRDQLPRRPLHRDGRRRRPGTRPGRGPGRRAGPHQRPRLPQRQALAGRRRAAQGRDRRHIHGQHPAPGVARRRRRVDHRRPAARDRPRRGGPPGRPDRAGRHVAPGTAPPDGARQHLPARQDGRRPLQLLPPRQPHRPARAGPAVDRRPCSPYSRKAGPR
ncbi:hypothetical protein SBADM41S_05591 [Streptomyces badius]